MTETVDSTVVTTYTYNAANQLVTARSSDDGVTWHYTYDKKGNLLRQTPGGLDPAAGEIRYSYNAADQVVKVELYTNGGYTLLSEATYNGDGTRMTLTTYALGIPQTITYVVAGGQLLAANNGRQTTLYLPGQKTILAEHNGSWSYPLYDATGSVRQLVDGAASINSSRSYKPFGGVLAEEGAYETATPKNKTKG